MPPGIARVDILLTHLHMDHIQGLGFFGPLYHPGIEVHIWGPPSCRLPLETRLSRYLSPPLFPVHLRDLPRVTCHEVPAAPFELGPFRDPHRAGLPPRTRRSATGSRTDGRSAVYLPDHEPALASRTGRWLAPEWTSGYDARRGRRSC